MLVPGLLFINMPVLLAHMTLSDFKLLHLYSEMICNLNAILKSLLSSHFISTFFLMSIFFCLLLFTTVTVPSFSINHLNVHLKFQSCL